MVGGLAAQGSRRGREILQLTPRVGRTGCNFVTNLIHSAARREGRGEGCVAAGGDATAYFFGGHLLSPPRSAVPSRLSVSGADR